MDGSLPLASDQDVAAHIVRALQQIPVVYCDAIAARIRQALLPRCDEAELLTDVSRVHYDLHPTEGYLISTKKTIDVTDINGRRYLVTVEEVRP